MAPRLTEVFVIREAKTLTFQQLQLKNPQAAQSWERQINDMTDGYDEDGKGDPRDAEFYVDGLRIRTDYGGEWFYDPAKRFWDLVDNQRMPQFDDDPGQKPRPPLSLVKKDPLGGE